MVGHQTLSKGCQRPFVYCQWFSIEINILTYQLKLTPVVRQNGRTRLWIPLNRRAGYDIIGT